jgi:endonuclease/exonuclease/phosphatase family metal-dependent hydrolase
MAEVAGEILKYGMDVVALQEIRWRGHGRVNKNNYSLFYSGPETRTGQYGTGFIINTKVKRSFLSFEPLGDRMCKTRLKGRFRNLSFISAYAPTEETDNDEKTEFYDRLDKECSNVPKYDILVLLGDFNAKVGKDDFLRHVAGKHSLHNETSENRKLLSQLAEGNRLTNKSICFENKNIHKGTWKVPSSGVVNQIDHVLVSRRHASSIVDVRSARGPNCDSDQYLVKALLRERLADAGSGKGPKRGRWDVEKLRQQLEIATQYQEMLSRKLAEIPKDIEQRSVATRWMEIKKVIGETAKVIGEKRRVRNEEWFDDECRIAIEQKNTDRVIMIQRQTRQNYGRYKESRSRANKILRGKERGYLKDWMREIEELNIKSESRKFYQAVKWMTKDYQPRTNSCRDENGKVI